MEIYARWSVGKWRAIYSVSRSSHSLSLAVCPRPYWIIMLLNNYKFIIPPVAVAKWATNHRRRQQMEIRTNKLDFLSVILLFIVVYYIIVFSSSASASMAATRIYSYTYTRFEVRADCAPCCVVFLFRNVFFISILAQHLPCNCVLCRWLAWCSCNQSNR